MATSCRLLMSTCTYLPWRLHSGLVTRGETFPVSLSVSSVWILHVWTIRVSAAVARGSSETPWGSSWSTCRGDTAALYVGPPRSHWQTSLSTQLCAEPMERGVWGWECVWEGEGEGEGVGVSGCEWCEVLSKTQILVLALKHHYMIFQLTIPTRSIHFFLISEFAVKRCWSNGSMVAYYVLSIHE